MKSKPTKKAAKKQASCFDRAADLIIDYYEQPQNLLIHVTSAQTAVSDYCATANDLRGDFNNTHFTLTQLLTEVVYHWMANPSRAIESISQGLEEIYNGDHSAGFFNDLSRVTIAQGYKMLEMGGGNSWLLDALKNLTVWCEVAELFSEHEFIANQEKTNAHAN